MIYRPLAFLALLCLMSSSLAEESPTLPSRTGGIAKNVIFFVGDGMGVSTVTATRVFSVGVDGQLTLDEFPFTALSRTATTDHITPDSAGTMTSMMTGVNTNSGVIGFGPETERRDFNGDGDGPRLWTLLELAEQNGMKTGVVSTARVTHATPAACYAHVNHRGLENEIALQALPTDSTYNTRLGDGIDILMGGGRRYFTPGGMVDEEGETGSRPDGRDLRQEFQDAGYTYVWNEAQFHQLGWKDLPILALFERSHMEYEYDRQGDLGGEPSLKAMSVKATRFLQRASKDSGFFLMVESGRIDHAHHAGNSYRSLTDTEEFDEAIAAVAKIVDLEETLIVVTADHSHVFTIAGYPMRPKEDLPFDLAGAPKGYLDLQGNGILDIVYDLDSSTGEVYTSTDSHGIPYTALGYHNGPGFRGLATRVDPRDDIFPGMFGQDAHGPWDPDYRQEAAVPLGSETHSGEEVAIYAVGPGSSRFHGTVRNSFIFEVLKDALGF